MMLETLLTITSSHDRIFWGSGGCASPPNILHPPESFPTPPSDGCTSDGRILLKDNVDT